MESVATVSVVATVSDVAVASVVAMVSVVATVSCYQGECCCYGAYCCHSAIASVVAMGSVVPCIPPCVLLYMMLSLWWMEHVTFSCTVTSTTDPFTQQPHQPISSTS